MVSPPLVFDYLVNEEGKIDRLIKCFVPNPDCAETPLFDDKADTSLQLAEEAENFGIVQGEPAFDILDIPKYSKEEDIDDGSNAEEA